MSFLWVFMVYVLNYKIVTTSPDAIPFSAHETLAKNIAYDLSEKPKNIILFIADGMGFTHLTLAMQTEQSREAALIWQKFDTQGWHDTRSFYGPLTDSGASATAMATGEPTLNGVIGLDYKGNILSNIMELASRQEYATGIVTDSYIWDATPAAFASHTASRENAKDILTQIASSKLDLIFGELEDLGEDEVPDKEETFNILRERFYVIEDSLDGREITTAAKPVALLFSEDQIQDLNSSPNLKEMTAEALTILTEKDIPFLLLVESEEIDTASHKNDSERVLKGLRTIEETLSLLLDFSSKNEETLLVFTSDHETGGLAVVSKDDDYPDMQLIWSTTEHSTAVVPILSYGPGAEHFSELHRNWQIGNLLKDLISKKE